MTSVSTPTARTAPLRSTSWTCSAPTMRAADAAANAGHVPTRLAGDYPLARWYLRPLAFGLARCLAATPIRPWHLTLCGLMTAVGAAATLSLGPPATAVSAGLVLLAWFFDRADGQLARVQGSASRWGAWLDANVDELVDIGLHVAVAATAAAWIASPWPWTLLAAFVAGKYLFMYGLMAEEAGLTAAGDDDSVRSDTGRARSWIRRAYHLPANADVRVHLLAVALLTGWLTTELWLIAVYYNVRWVARYVLVARRLRGLSP